MNDLKKLCYIARAIDTDIFYKSQSGGLFVLISDYILEKEGVIFAACLNENRELCHIKIEDKELRNRARGSVYIQSSLKDTYRCILDYIVQNRFVMFIGTPCQCSGLRQYLICRNVSMDCLLIVDILCHGVASTRIWKDYIAYYSKKNGRLKNIILNTNNNAIRPYFDFEFAKNVVSDFYFKKIYYSNLALRPSCYSCKFTNLDRVGDISIGDAQRTKENDPIFYNPKGTSLLLINTELGSSVFKEIVAKLEYKQVDINNYIQDALHMPAKAKRNRDNFWIDYKTKSFKFILMKYAENRIIFNLRYVFHQMLERIGL